MGKKFTILLLLVAVCQFGYGQKNMDQLFREFSSNEQVTKLNMGKFVLNCANLFTDVLGVEGIEILSFDNCGTEFREHFNEVIRNFKDSNYETMVQSNENGGRTKIMIQIKNDVIRELVVLTSGESPALVRIKGKIKKTDIDRIVNGKKNGC